MACGKLGISPIPYLIAQALASNIGGAATLIGDPPNIIIGSRAGLSFNDFVLNMGPIVVVLFMLFVAISRLMFRRSFEYRPDRVAEVMALDEREALASWVGWPRPGRWTRWRSRRCGSGRRYDPAPWSSWG